ncbi:hypothetical protein [Actinospica robiniae]|uniref:hypothetical protein n=1 Tax=Actinospica robiniae TaxID=304901 RepID=UPI0004113488|nr:hypothetical protein [Actinospica robiniae]
MLRLTRWMIGALLAVAGAIIAIWSVFLNWYGNRDGSDIRIWDLFNHATTTNSDTATSLLLPMAIAAVLVLAGVVVGWRWLWALAGLVVITTVYLWGLRQAQTVPGLHATLVGAGVPLAFSGGALMLVGSALAARRRRKRTPAAERREYAAERDHVSPEWAPDESTQVGGATMGTGEPRSDYGDEQAVEGEGQRRRHRLHL